MSTKQILGLMKVISWIIFIGLCIKTGAIITSFLISLFINPEAAQSLYLGLDLSELYKLNIWYFVNTMSFIIILSGQKAYIFYLVIRIFLKVDFNRPFSTMAVSLISKISHVTLGIGIVALVAQNYTKRLLNRGVLVEQNWESSDFLFLAGVIFIIALVFKRGVEIQSENELTI
jgi:hypothetical protein